MARHNIAFIILLITFIIFINFFTCKIYTAEIENIEDTLLNIETEEDLMDYIYYDNYEELVEAFYEREKRLKKEQKIKEIKKKKKRIADNTFTINEYLRDEKNADLKDILKTYHIPYLWSKFNIRRRRGYSDVDCDEGYLVFRRFVKEKDKLKKRKKTRDQLVEEIIKEAENLDLKAKRALSIEDIMALSEKKLNKKTKRVKKKKQKSLLKDELFFGRMKLNVDSVSKSTFAKSSRREVKATTGVISTDTYDGLKYLRHFKNSDLYFAFAKVEDSDEYFGEIGMQHQFTSLSKFSWYIAGLKDTDSGKSITGLSFAAFKKLKNGPKLTGRYTHFFDFGDGIYIKLDTRINKFKFMTTFKKLTRKLEDIMDKWPFTPKDSMSAGGYIKYLFNSSNWMKLSFYASDSNTVEPGGESHRVNFETQFKPLKKAVFRTKYGHSKTSSGYITRLMRGDLVYNFSKKTRIKTYVQMKDSDIDEEYGRTTTTRFNWEHEFSESVKILLGYTNVNSSQEEVEHRLYFKYRHNFY